MLRQRREFALHEFGSFEFGLESIARATLASFEGEGAGQAQGTSQVYAFSEAKAQGVATPYLHLSAIANTKAKGEGKASLDPIAVLVRSGAFQAYGDTHLLLRGGRGVGGTFAAEGQSDGLFYYFEGNEFHIRPHSSMEIFAWATAHVETFIKGSSDAQAVGGSYTLSRLESESAAQVLGIGGSFNHGTYSVRGAGQVRTRAQRVATSNTFIQGHTFGTPRAQTVVNRRFEAKGEAGLLIPAAPLYKRDTRIQIQGQGNFSALSQFKQFIDTGFLHEGNTRFLAYGQQVIGVVLAAEGTSHVIWWRGRNTLPFIDPSYVRFVRPEELRTLMWTE